MANSVDREGFRVIFPKAFYVMNRPGERHSEPGVDPLPGRQQRREVEEYILNFRYSTFRKSRGNIKKR